MKPTVSLACSRNVWTSALLDGVVTVEGVDLIPCEVAPGELFWRQLRYGDFDVCELSLSSLVMRHSRGDREWRAVPAFPSRACFHTATVVRGDRVTDPGDLKGCRVGVPEYQQTAAVWTRGALEHEFGVLPADMEWVMGRSPGQSHGTSTGFSPPDGLSFRYARPEEGGLAQMLADGALDAVVAFTTRRGGLGFGQEDAAFGGRDSGGIMDQERMGLDEVPGTRPLFPDARAESSRYIAATSIVPMNHAFVLRDELGERYRWLPLNLWRALCQSRDVGLQRLRKGLEVFIGLGFLAEAAVDDAVQRMAYGVRANRTTLQALVTYIHEQGLSSRLADVGELFWETTADV